MHPPTFVHFPPSAHACTERAQSAVSAASRCGKEMDAYLAAYEGMFNEFGVDLFMAGHNHMWGRGGH
jgi:hypothetical protein